MQLLVHVNPSHLSDSRLKKIQYFLPPIRARREAGLELGEDFDAFFELKEQIVVDALQGCYIVGYSVFFLIY